MAHRKKHERQSGCFRPKGNSKSLVVLSIVATDNTFAIHGVAGDWLGKCIHCNSKLFVTKQGTTPATIEHINPLCNDGEPLDPRNLALACSRCNNMKGVHHDQHVGKGGRADEVVMQLQLKRQSRWRDPVTNS